MPVKHLKYNDWCNGFSFTESWDGFKTSFSEEPGRTGWLGGITSCSGGLTRGAVGVIGGRAEKTDSPSFPDIPTETDWGRRSGIGAAGVENVSGRKAAETEEGEATVAEAWDEMLGLIHACPSLKESIPVLCLSSNIIDGWVARRQVGRGLCSVKWRAEFNDWQTTGLWSAYPEEGVSNSSKGVDGRRSLTANDSTLRKMDGFATLVDTAPTDDETVSIPLWTKAYKSYDK